MMTEVQRYFCEEIMERRDAMRVEDVIISIRAIAHNVGVFLNYHLEKQQPLKIREFKS